MDFSSLTFLPSLFLSVPLSSTFMHSLLILNQFSIKTSSALLAHSPLEIHPSNTPTDIRKKDDRKKGKKKNEKREEERKREDREGEEKEGEKEYEEKKMPCVHKNLDHDTAAEVFAAGWVGNWHQLLDLPVLAFWFLLALGLSLKVCGSPVIGMASAAALIWSYRSTLRYAIWVIWMLGVLAHEAKYRGCLYYASYGEPQLGYGATIRYRPTEPQDPTTGPKQVRTKV